MSGLASGLRILRYFLEQSDWIDYPEAAAQLGLSPVILKRKVRELVDAGLLAPVRRLRADTAGMPFRPGSEALLLASAVRANFPIASVAEPILRDLVRATDESVVLNVYAPDLRAALCVAVEESACPLQYHIEVGEVKALHAGASGKAILALLPDEEIDLILSGELARVTPRTQVDAGELRQELAEIRKLGYVISFGQRITGAVGIAGALRSYNGLAASLVLTIPEHRFRAHDRSLLLAKLLDHARELEQRFQDFS